MASKIGLDMLSPFNIILHKNFIKIEDKKYSINEGDSMKIIEH